jgi:hypothetical protein
MIRDWDQLLHTGEPLIGTWTSDSHRNATLGPATFIEAPALDELSLLHSLFEGRTFLAPVEFAGTASFTEDGGAGSYPARYPLYRSAQDDLATFHLAITGGLEEGESVVWLRDGQVVRSDAVGGTSFTGELTLALPSTSTPVRVEVRRPDGSRALMTEPIMARTAAGLPRGISLHVERVSTPSGTGYTKSMVQGITDVAWDAGSTALTTTLNDPAGSTVEQLVSTGSWDATGVTIDGTPLPQAANRAALEAGTSDGWAFDTTAHQLAVRATHSGNTGILRIAMAPGSDTTPPTTPTLTALAQDALHVSLSWTPSDDDSGVASYVISRNGTVLAAVPGSSTTFADSNVTPDTSYTYTIRARDVVANESGTATATVHTQPAVTTTLGDTIDSYVSSAAPTTNYGTAKTMKADASPDTRSYLRFTPAPTQNKLLSAVVSLTSTAALPGGVRLNAVSDHSWTERGITYNNAPTVGAQVGSSAGLTGGVASSTYITSYVESLPSGSPVDLAVTNPSGTNVSLYTRENLASVPQLALTTSTVAPHASDLSVSTQENTPVSFTPAVSGGAGPLSCSIGTPLPSGTAWVASDCSTGEISPGQDQVGTTSFTYAVTDGQQTVSATVTVTVTGVNNAPTTDQEVLGAGTDEDTPVTLVLQGEDIDGDCPLTFTITGAPVHGSLGALSTPSCSGGSATASVLYTPDAQFSGTDALSYTVSDPSGATSAAASFAISVAPVDDPPVAGNLTLNAVNGQTVTFTPSASDVDSSSLTCAIGTPPANGSATVASNCSTGSYTAGASGTSDSFTYTVSDATSTRSGSVTVSITASGPPLLFSDGFESGTLNAWTRKQGAVISTVTPRTGAYDLDVDTTDGKPAYVRRSLPSGLTSTTSTSAIRLVTAPVSGMTSLLRLKSADDTALLTVQVDSTGRVKLRDELAKTAKSSTSSLTPGTWNVLQLRVVTSGSSTTAEVLLNGTVLTSLTTTPNLGSYRVAALQVGENAKGTSGHFLADDVQVTGS